MRTTRGLETLALALTRTLTLAMTEETEQKFPAHISAVLLRLKWALHLGTPTSERQSFLRPGFPDSTDFGKNRRMERRGNYS